MNQRNKAQNNMYPRQFEYDFDAILNSSGEKAYIKKVRQAKKNRSKKARRHLDEAEIKEQNEPGD